MVGEHPTQTSLPGEDLKPAWRVACVAYRKVRQVGELDQPAWLAARAAIQELRHWARLRGAECTWLKLESETSSG